MITFYMKCESLELNWWSLDKYLEILANETNPPNGCLIKLSSKTNTKIERSMGLEVVSYLKNDYCKSNNFFFN